MRCKSVFILLFSIVFIGIASASFEYYKEGSLIVSNYSPSETLKLDLNISFLNQSLESVFIDSLGNEVSLNELLGRNIEYEGKFSDITNTSIDSAPQILSFNETGIIMSSSEKVFDYYIELDGKKIFEKEFKVALIKGEIDYALEKKKALLNASKSKIETYDIYTQSILNKYLNIESIELELKSIENKYLEQQLESQEEILESINRINLPTNFYLMSYSQPMRYYPERESIDLSVLADLSRIDFRGNRENYLDAIFLWNNQNIVTTIESKKIEITYENKTIEILNIFDFSSRKTENYNSAPYAIIKDLGDNVFDNISRVYSGEGYFYLVLNEISNKFVFATKSNIDFFSVPVFISPDIDKLTPVDSGQYERWKAQNRWLWFILVIFLLLLIFAITYILVQRWYIRKYETYLFKTKNNMYNIMVYIHDSKIKNIPRETVEKNLKKAGWTREQINYAMRKYENKKIKGIVGSPMNIGSQEPKKEVKKSSLKK